MVYFDINEYCDNDFESWSIQDFVEYIKYLENLTQINNSLGL